MGLPANLINQTIVHYPRTGADAYGRETNSSGVSYKARVQEVSKLRFTPTGQTYTVDAVVYLSGNPSISANDRVSYSGTNYKVHSRAVAVDGQGNGHNTKLELIKWNL